MDLAGRNIFLNIREEIGKNLSHGIGIEQTGSRGIGLKIDSESAPGKGGSELLNGRLDDLIHHAGTIFRTMLSLLDGRKGEDVIY